LTYRTSCTFLPLASSSLFCCLSHSSCLD
jgi:hypothetical protein